MRLKSGCTLILIAITIIWQSCTYDTNIPLQNHEPECNFSQIEKTLQYPDSVICTLSIKDMNDRFLKLSITDTDGQFEDNWPGTFKFLNNDYGNKRVVLFDSRSEMGFFSGILRLTDYHEGVTSLNYNITKVFKESFASYPLDTCRWKLYAKSDTSVISYDFMDKKLMFLFGAEDSASLSAGIRSVFAISSDFHSSVNFKLRDDMSDGFEASFFVSTSPDTGKWSGKVAGVFIAGNAGRLRLTCKSIDFQIQSKEIELYSGELTLKRTGNILQYSFHDGNPQSEVLPLAEYTFIPDTGLYVHLRMKVDECSRIRSCSWKNFTVQSGTLNF